MSGDAWAEVIATLAPPTFASTTLTDLLRGSAEAVRTALAAGAIGFTMAGMTADDRYLVTVGPADLRRAAAALLAAPVPPTVKARGRRITTPSELPPDFGQRDDDELRVSTRQRRRAAAATAGADRTACVVRPAPAEGVPAHTSADADGLGLPVPFPIDIVYTWVDDSDGAWLERKRRALHDVTGRDLNFAATAAGRYTNRDELKYSLRSVEHFAPWVNHIYIVTDDQCPDWLDTTHPQVDVVSHRDIFDPADGLPVFNSHAIESQLHHIDGLSEHYLYMNDDFLFGRPVDPSLFFGGNGVARFFESKARIPLGEPTVSDAPVDAAAKNVRTMMQRTFARTVTRKFKHAPQPQQRSICYEMEQRYAEEFSRTARSRFRHPADVSIPSSLQHHYAYLSGRAIAGDIVYRYIALEDHEPSLAKIVDLLARREADCYCLNDADVPEVDLTWADETLAAFLTRYYPFQSRFEAA